MYILLEFGLYEYVTIIINLRTSTNQTSLQEKGICHVTAIGRERNPTGYLGYKAYVGRIPCFAGCLTISFNAQF